MFKTLSHKLAAVAVTAGLVGGGVGAATLVAAPTAQAAAYGVVAVHTAATSHHSVTKAAPQACRTGREQVDGECLAIAGTARFAPAASEALEKVFSTPAGRTALLNVFRSIKGAKVGIAASPFNAVMHDDLSCPGGVQCGISGSGGLHFWIIGSYATLESGVIGGLGWYCGAFLSPFITPIGAAVACGGVVYTLSTIVNNWPRFTNHGVWVAVYPTHISWGRY
jgi:hypothetical protein